MSQLFYILLSVSSLLLVVSLVLQLHGLLYIHFLLVHFSLASQHYNNTASCVCLCSPSGKLVQIEYALAAVAAGAPSVGIKGKESE